MVGIRIYDELSFWQVPTRKTLIAITTMSLLLCTIVWDVVVRRLLECTLRGGQVGALRIG